MQKIKADKVLKLLTIAAIKRSAMEPESWMCSKVCIDDKCTEFVMEQDELPVFEVNSPKAHTIITSRRIIEMYNDNVNTLNIDDIDDVIYGNFKKQINKPELSRFRVVDFYGGEYDFQMETGKAAIGLIKCLNTLIKLRAQS